MINAYESRVLFMVSFAPAMWLRLNLSKHNSPSQITRIRFPGSSESVLDLNKNHEEKLVSGVVHRGIYSASSHFGGAEVYLKTLQTVTMIETFI